MGFLSRLFGRETTDFEQKNSSPETSGELIAEQTNGANLVDGKQTLEYAEEKKHDIECMKDCCAAELKTMKLTGLVPAPYYFERVAILSRKNKDYKQEIEYCTSYIDAVEDYYTKNDAEKVADVRKGPRYQAIVKRLPKAKELLEKQKAT